MAFSTCKGLTYAKYSSGGNESALVYTGGKVKTDYLCQVQINEARNNDKEYADGHLIDTANIVNEVTVNLELANTDTDLKTDLLGHKAGTGDALIVTDADAPFVGVGFILAHRYKGVETFEAYWFYKVQFSTAGITSNTKRENQQWEHETINGLASSVVQSAGGTADFYEHLDGQTTEAAARTWLNSKAGVSA